MDTHTPEQRSYNMSRIKLRNTTPELSFKKFVRSRGIRDYRVTNKIFGRPDLYFPSKKIALFIDGCFWHKCTVCFVKPKSNNEYWDKKIERNLVRDREVNYQLQKEKIDVIRIWEHEVAGDVEQAFNKLKIIYDAKI